ncbi:MAG TPA: biotin/lipoyl-containing protein, partial [Arenibaculum sp.]|nr:biotin/lipoyl-containing protein [Arenibaculum sp.]
MSTIEVTVPDIGDFKDVPIIEVHVAPGAKVNAEDPIITLESDKATMDIPAPQAGTVQEVKVKTGDRVSQGSLILLLDEEGAAGIPAKERIREGGAPTPDQTGPANYGSPAGVYDVIDVKVPDIGDFTGVEIIEVHVEPGAAIKAEDPLITLESDKASMEIPAPAAGTVAEMKVKKGDRVSHGDLALLAQTGEAAGQALDHAVLPGAQLVDVDRRLAEADAVRGHVTA